VRSPVGRTQHLSTMILCIFFFLLQKCRKKKLRLFFSWFDGWIVQYFLTLKILYIYWNVRMNEGKRWKLLVDDL
jgi:uncharacterized membrane protein